MTEQLNVNPMKMSDEPRLPLSTSCLVKLSVAALIGTGVLAGLDRVHGRADGVQSPAPRAQGDPAASTGSHLYGPEGDPPASTGSHLYGSEGDPDASTGSHLYGPPMAEPERFSKPQARLVTEATPEPSAMYAPSSATSPEEVASGTAQDGRGSAHSETQATDAEPASLQGSHASAPSEAGQDAPGDCPSSELRAVLADVTARFGAVTVVAAHQVKTANHIAGSIREKLHHDCKAVDFRPDPSRVEEIKAYLRRRPEISSIESYRDGVIHMDTGAASARGAAKL
jgi:uncharacterized protein YcbK (DUF882 family)